MTAPTEAERGDCFKVAAGFMTSGARAFAAAGRIPYRKDDRSPFRIVHGLPLGQAGDVAGIRHWHAWVEVATLTGTLVLDYSNDKEVRLGADTYYRIGHLDEEHVWRFTLAEAERAYRRFGHCGPWVHGWERMGEADREGAST